MNKQAIYRKKVAILLTGNEITNGEIADGNGYPIASKLLKHKIENGLRLLCPDEQIILEQSIHFLLTHHDALITIGGLGPTSDDRTRFAIANVTGQTLDFDQATWDHIVARFSQRQIHVSDNNRQQAMFPKNARIIPNANGSASACELSYQTKLIFMLPGPPNECLPIFDQFTLPRLVEESFCQHYYRQRWTITGIGEGNIAAQLDPLLELYQFTLAYRSYKPYIDLKISCDNEEIFAIVRAKIETIIKPYLV